ncbi:MAG: RNA polymerase-associated protein RapA [Sedimenticola sp.]|nr:RNA polymerase-associated protein RapA [Sedimenticola sp.]
MQGQHFIPGQRWISDSEPELGLGRVTATAPRTIDLHFDASNENRRYALAGAPLSRARFEPGDTILDTRGTELRVTATELVDGLLVYRGTRLDGSSGDLLETELSPYIQFNRPQVKLFAGQSDDNRWFRLRRETLLQRERLERSSLIGLGGARTELLPHQLFIAHQVGQRQSPRVLLADEVGLGKTIEAGLILHAQLLTGRAQRALIVVPAPLLHQWLVELLRRFNLHFSLLDEARCHAIVDSGENDNPFLSAQLVLCSLDLLTESADRLQQAKAGEWDLLIVDEAHHLEWHEEGSSPAYEAIATLAEATPGVLLLTATPEQLGQDGHFARLRLLDPDRFYSLEQFHQEQSEYQPVADAAAELISGQPLTAGASGVLEQLIDEQDTQELLSTLRQEGTPPSARQQARGKLISLLLDRHGTGRGMYRNTRERVEGFKARRFHAYPLDLPALYRDVAQQETGAARELLYPEQLQLAADPDKEWWRADPRVDWLIELSRQLKREKLLLICAHASTAIGLERALRIREGISAALFHQEMTIIERDRAAAWFADPEQGCQLLLCSEIGSEGRNFQFAHHLVLFDLPENPDLLEQRIGRLDRIGQSATIELHAPYFRHTPQEVLLRWYHDGMNAFVHTCQTGSGILDRLAPALHEAYDSCGDELFTLNPLIDATRSLHREISQRLKAGRDHLLELNSCRPDEAESLVRDISLADRNPDLPEYMERLFDAYGIDSEAHSSDSLAIRPGTEVLTEQFPCLTGEGATVTYDRATALLHEDYLFLTWEHPMVLGGMELVLESGRGNCSAIALHTPQLAGGTLALELLYVLECPAPKSLQAGRFLPPTLLPLVIGQDLQTLELNPEQLEQERVTPLPRGVVRKLVTPLRGHIQGMIGQGERLASGHLSTVMQNARSSMDRHYDAERQRLQALCRINPNVKTEDILRLQQVQGQLAEHITSSRVRLDSIRLLVGV